MERKICVIVGAGPGLGLALARRFGSEDFIIAFISRRPEARRGYVSILRDEGMQAVGVAADPGNEESLKRAFYLISTQLGTPQVLIYNAVAREAHSKPSMLDVEVLIHDFRLNVVGALLCAQLVIPDMLDRQKGTILFTAGGDGVSTELPFTSLALGKESVRVLCRFLGAELKPYGINVATVVVRGTLTRGGRYDPERIAEAYWKLHEQVEGYQEVEFIYE